MDPEGVGTQQGAGGDAHRGAVRIVVGQGVGDLACPVPTDPRRYNVAVGRPPTGAHVPRVGRVEVTCGLQVLGDQGGILIDRFRLVAFYGDSHSAV